jgi:ribosome biogenesis protein UTP30
VQVLGLSKLRTKYESHEAKRALCAAHDLFLVDERVLPMLPKLLGKTFFAKKKQPIPVRLAGGGDLAAQVWMFATIVFAACAGSSGSHVRNALPCFAMCWWRLT